MGAFELDTFRQDIAELYKRESTSSGLSSCFDFGCDYKDDCDCDSMIGSGVFGRRQRDCICSEVVFCSLKVTAMEVGVVLQEPPVVVVGLLVVGVPGLPQLVDASVGCKVLVQHEHCRRSGRRQSAPLEGVYFCYKELSVMAQACQHIYKTYSNRHVAISVDLDSIDDRGEGSSRGCICANSSRRVDILEERKRDRDSIVQLLSGSKSIEGFRCSKNLQDGAERIGDDLVVGKSLVTAGLECGRIARSSRIKDVNASQNRVCILAGSTTSSVGKGIGASPVRLKEAKNLGRCCPQQEHGRRPDNVVDGRSVTVGLSCTESGTITLRSTPSTGKRPPLGLLTVCSNELIHKCLKHESRITGPGVKVWIDVSDGSYDFGHTVSQSGARSLGAACADVVEDALQSNSVLRREPGRERASSTLLNVLRRRESESSSEEQRKSGKETHDGKNRAVDDELAARFRLEQETCEESIDLSSVEASWSTFAPAQAICLCISIVA
ncbi:hypothetical protein KCU81_g154, partial [Aureobasidium melanogenum]